MVRRRSGALLLLALGLLTTGCATAGLVGATAVVLIGVGALVSTCYDRVEVTVVDQALGNKVCDAQVVFWEGSSSTEATNCYSASLSSGTYTLKVTRPGLEPFEQEITVDTKGQSCDSSLQTMYLAMDRAGGRIHAVPAPAAVPPPSATPAPSAMTAAPSAPPAASAVVPAPSAAPARTPSAAPAPSEAETTPIPAPVPSP